MLLLFPRDGASRLPVISSSPSARPSPEALAALGKMRERLAAVQNLEHLVASRTVGPKLLGQVAPDVAGMLGLWPEIARGLSERLASGLGLELSRLVGVCSLGQVEVTRLLETLKTTGGGMIQAKARLVLERRIRETLPALQAAVAHFELLVEGTGTLSVAMSVGELLSSSPDTGSERPYLPVRVVGELESLFVALPPRFGLSSLAAFGATTSGWGRELGLVVQGASEGRVEFSVAPVAPEVKVTQMPAFPAGKETLSAVEAALGPHGGTITGSPQLLSLPAARK